MSFEPFVHKHVAVLNASPRACHADTALRETLLTMSAHIVEPASITVPLLGAHLTEEGMVREPTVYSAIRRSLLALQEAVSASRLNDEPASCEP